MPPCHQRHAFGPHGQQSIAVYHDEHATCIAADNLASLLSGPASPALQLHRAGHMPARAHHREQEGRAQTCLRLHARSSGPSFPLLPAGSLGDGCSCCLHTSPGADCSAGAAAHCAGRSASLRRTPRHRAAAAGRHASSIGLVLARRGRRDAVAVMVVLCSLHGVELAAVI